VAFGREFGREIDGIATAFATRLLTRARPDLFVVVNNQSRPWLREVTGLKLAGKHRMYRGLIGWVAGQLWHASAAPADPGERGMWDARAALLDCFAYYAAIRQTRPAA